MRTIEYASNGLAFKDHECEEAAHCFLKEAASGEAIISVSTENFITVARVLIHEGVCSHQDVRFLYQGEYLYPDANGRLPVWPRGFCDIVEMFLARLLSPSRKQ